MESTADGVLEAFYNRLVEICWVIEGVLATPSCVDVGGLGHQGKRISVRKFSQSATITLLFRPTMASLTNHTASPRCSALYNSSVMNRNVPLGSGLA